MKFELAEKPCLRAFLGTLRKDLAIAFALALLIIPAARSAPPDEPTKALVDAAIALQRKGPERVRTLPAWETSSLLMKGEFEKLDSIIDQTEKIAQNDPTLEFQRHAAIRSVDWRNPNLLAALDRWVMQRPSARSHTARGVYLEQRAFDLRGTRFAKDTPALNYELMNMVAKLAVQDLMKAISLDRTYIPAYTHLITISMISRDLGVDAHQLVTQISQLQPSNYEPREAFLWTLDPRWGGSYEAMFRFAESAASDAKHNPLLWLLTGKVYHRLTQYREPNNPEQDIKDLTEALKYGETNFLLEARGDAYWRHKNYTAAIADYSKCVANNPTGPHRCTSRLKALTDWNERLRTVQ